MVLKEAYRYQNYLDRLINEAESYLTSRDFITTKEETHYRNKANTDASDETIIVPKKSDITATPMQIIDFIVKVLEEKNNLSKAIVEAKKTTEIDIDSSISMNKKYQEFITNLNYMNDVKPSEDIIIGTGYKINNVDGNQISYKYDINRVITIDYDRNDVKKLIKKYNKMCDEVSTKLDVIQITTEVKFNPIFEIGDSLEDVVLL